MSAHDNVRSEGTAGTLHQLQVLDTSLYCAAFNFRFPLSICIVYMIASKYICLYKYIII